MRFLGTKILLALVAAGYCQTGPAQQAATSGPLTLRQAVALALKEAPERRAAMLDVEDAQVNGRLAKSALLPAVFFTETATRGNDPVYVFGTRLRQQHFTEPDFALNQLNRPTPIGDFATRFSGDWTAFDSWKTEFAIRSAGKEEKSAQLTGLRTDQEIVHRVVIRYEGVLIAGKQLAVAQHQVATAQALLDSSRTRVTAGLAVDSDELSAAANLSARQQEQIAAEGDLAIAWAELERVEGASIPDSQRQIPELAPAHFEAPALGGAISTALRERPDRKSLDQQRSASRESVREARSSFAPRLHAFGNWEEDRGSFGGSGGNNWTVGMELNVDILPFAKRQQLQRARIAEERVRVSGLAAEEQIRLEVTRAWYAQQTAARMLDVARASLTQTDESLRILRNRYSAGLATMTDLLRGEDAQRENEANYWTAVSRSKIAWSDLEFAMGTLNATNLDDQQWDGE